MPQNIPAYTGASGAVFVPINRFALVSGVQYFELVLQQMQDKIGAFQSLYVYNPSLADLTFESEVTQQRVTIPPYSYGWVQFLVPNQTRVKITASQAAIVDFTFASQVFVQTIEEIRSRQFNTRAYRSIAGADIFINAVAGKRIVIRSVSVNISGAAPNGFTVDIFSSSMAASPFFTGFGEAALGPVSWLDKEVFWPCEIGDGFGWEIVAGAPLSPCEMFGSFTYEIRDQ